MTVLRFFHFKTKDDYICLYYYSSSGFGSVVSSVFLRCAFFKFRERVQKKKGMGPVYYVKRTSNQNVRKNQKKER